MSKKSPTPMGRRPQGPQNKHVRFNRIIDEMNAPIPTNQDTAQTVLKITDLMDELDPNLNADQKPVKETVPRQETDFLAPTHTRFPVINIPYFSQEESESEGGRYDDFNITYEIRKKAENNSDHIVIPDATSRPGRKGVEFVPDPPAPPLKKSPPEKPPWKASVKPGNMTEKQANNKKGMKKNGLDRKLSTMTNVWRPYKGVSGPSQIVKNKTVGTQVTPDAFRKSRQPSGVNKIEGLGRSLDRKNKKK